MPSAVFDVVRSSGSNAYFVDFSVPASSAFWDSTTWSKPSYTLRSMTLPPEVTDSWRPNGS
ncbi:hypothetical protein [Streptomyces sp. NPDC057582]|uniref:hypothetical protein n=1 Tax=Streptomyces sp. NPDC057582 TaxID=3346174 RepID=UPI0036A974E5